MAADVVTMADTFRASVFSNAEQIRMLLERAITSRRSSKAVVSTLRALTEISGGHVASGIALFEKASAEADGVERQYIIDLIVPLLHSTGNPESANRYLASGTDDVKELVPAHHALRALMLAHQGRTEDSKHLAEQIRASLVNDPGNVVALRARSRLATAAFLCGDFADARDDASEAAHRFEAIKAYRSAAAAFSLLFSIAHQCIEDPEQARIAAEHVAKNGRLAEDRRFEVFGTTCQFTVAVQAGDEPRVDALRALVRANARGEQFMEHYALLVSEILLYTWRREFRSARGLCELYLSKPAIPLAQRSFCVAFIALLDLIDGDTSQAKRFAHRVLGQTTAKAGVETGEDEQTRREARITAACACIIAGDVTRGVRGLTRFADENGAFAELAAHRRLDETRVPPFLRGLARAINIVAEDRARIVAGHHNLTGAELRVLRLLVLGHTIPEIAGMANLSPHTVKGHVKSTYVKLGAQNRVRAISRARELKIVE